MDVFNLYCRHSLSTGSTTGEDVHDGSDDGVRRVFGPCHCPHRYTIRRNCSRRRENGPLVFFHRRVAGTTDRFLFIIFFVCRCFVHSSSTAMESINQSYLFFYFFFCAQSLLLRFPVIHFDRLLLFIIEIMPSCSLVHFCILVILFRFVFSLSSS